MCIFCNSCKNLVKFTNIDPQNAVFTISLFLCELSRFVILYETSIPSVY